VYRQPIVFEKPLKRAACARTRLVALKPASLTNLHGGGNGPRYTPIANDAAGHVVGARPEYYGVLLFEQAAHGRIVPATIGGGVPTLSAHAVAEDDQSTVVVLVNRDPARAVLATVDFSAPRTAGTQLDLTALTLASTSGVLVGGATVGNDGAWTPATSAVAVSGSVSVVAVALASAAMVRAIR
jgi:hypothetical protein